MTPEKLAELLHQLVGKSVIICPTKKWIRLITEVKTRKEGGLKWVTIYWTPEQNPTDRLSTDFLDCGYTGWDETRIKEKGLEIIRSFSIVAKPKRHHRPAEPSDK